MFGKHGRKITGKQACTWQDLAAARRVQEVAIKGWETAQQAVAALQKVWIQEVEANNSERADEIKQELNEAKQERKVAKQELNDAKQEYEQA